MLTLHLTHTFSQQRDRDLVNDESGPIYPSLSIKGRRDEPPER